MQSVTRGASVILKTNTVSKTLRSSNIEFLRILAMIGIVMSHLVLSSPNGPQIVAAGNHQTLYLVLLQASGQIGVFIFFLITGYFMVKKEFSLNGVKKTLGIVWFYSALLFIFALIVGALSLNTFFAVEPASTALTAQNVLKNSLPILQDNYWFVNAYIVILFLAPAFNKIILATSKRRLQLVLIGVAIGFFGLNLLSRAQHWGMNFEIYNNLLLYSLVYWIGAYLMLHPIKLNTKWLLVLMGISLVLYFIWRYATVYILHSTDIANKDTDFPPFAISTLLFVLFLRLKMPHVKWINVVGASTFAVYIIHTNVNIWHFIWKTFDVYSVFGTVWVYIYPVFIATLVFAICVCIELARQWVFTKIRESYANHKLEGV